jgi:hypothetical protein
MKKLSFFSFTALILACVVLCAGCITIQPLEGTPQKSSTPAESAQPATEAPQSVESPALSLPVESSAPPQPDAAALPADISVQMSLLADLNGDGVKEAIFAGLGKELEFGNDIVLSVSDNGSFNEVTLDVGYFISAYVAETPGGAPCVIVSCGYEDDYYTTYACSFDGLRPVVGGSTDGYATYVSYSSVTLNGYVDALGTWSYSRLFNLTDAFVFEQATDMMIDMKGRGPLVTKADIPVEMLVGGEYTPATLEAGTAVYPEATDGSSFVLFKLDDGTEGRIVFTVSDYEHFIGGVSEYDCFVELPYAG